MAVCAVQVLMAKPTAMIMAALAIPTVKAAAGKMKHVLMIASDDMRPEISPYGHTYMSTPNMQALADDGVTMRRLYVQQDCPAVLTPPRYKPGLDHRALLPGTYWPQLHYSTPVLQDQDQKYGSWSVPYYHPSVQYDKWNNSDRPP
eukprot:gene3185-3709_t